MLCELHALSHSFIATWILVALLALVMVFALSTPIFYFYYWPSNVTYENWRYKSNPKFPSAEKVRDEIITMCKGVVAAALCPVTSIYLTQKGYGYGYCGWNGYSFIYHVGVFMFTLVVSDFFEFSYHRLGHTDFRFWRHHKHHHEFFNPSPFSVIADEWIDQLIRSSPLLIFPLLLPVNLDVLFFQFAFFFYVYGVYLHCGYELKWISPHNKYINTSFQHYVHHAKSLMNKPYHCGFFVKVWDRMFDCCYPDDKCICAECERSKGKRTQEAYKEIKIPDYSKLFTPTLWLQYFNPVKTT